MENESSSSSKNNLNSPLKLRDICIQKIQLEKPEQSKSLIDFEISVIGEKEEEEEAEEVLIPESDLVNDSSDKSKGNKKMFKKVTIDLKGEDECLEEEVENDGEELSKHKERKWMNKKVGVNRRMSLKQDEKWESKEDSIDRKMCLAREGKWDNKEFTTNMFLERKEHELETNEGDFKVLGRLRGTRIEWKDEECDNKSLELSKYEERKWDQNAVLAQLLNFCRILSPEGREIVIRDISQLFSLDMDARSWRQRADFADQLTQLISLLPIDVINKYLCAYALTFSADRISQVRINGTIMLSLVIKTFIQHEWTEYKDFWKREHLSDAIPITSCESSMTLEEESINLPLTFELLREIRSGFWLTRSWRRRQSFAHLLYLLIQTCGFYISQFYYLFFHDFMCLSDDNVPNIRQYFCLIAQFERFEKYVGVSVIKRLEQMSADDTDLEVRHLSKVLFSLGTLDPITEGLDITKRSIGLKRPLDEEFIKHLINDEKVPDYARAIIELLANDVSVLTAERLAIIKAIGSDRYKLLIKRGINMLEEDSGWMPDMLTIICVLLFIFVIFYALRQWIKGAQFTEKISARGRVAIVTGANSGIGMQLVRELNLRYVKVYMACRRVSSGNEATRELFSRYGCDMTRMIVRHCDLSDFSSVRHFVDEFNRDEEKLDILINNAGIMFYPQYEKTIDGHELTWQSNHLGHFLLTELLLPKLELSEEGGRIVNVSSSLHLLADNVDPEIVDSPQHFGRWNNKTYGRSKLANIMHCVELTRRIRSFNSASKVTANACHPGSVDTSLFRAEFYQKYLKTIVSPIVWFLLKTAQDGAQTPLYLALSKKVAGVSGKYFSECKESKKVHPLASDPLACEILYNNSLEQFDGNYCMTAGSDKSVKLWNPYKRIHLNTYRLGNEVLDCCGSSDNSLILAGGRDKQPTIFDVESGKTLKRWRGHGGTVNAVAFNEDASVAISAGQDGFVCLYDVRSRGPPFQVLDEARDGVLCLDVNAYEIATGSADGNFRRYDIREGRLSVDFVKDPVTSVNLTADNQCLLVTTMGSGIIRLFEKCNGQLLASYTGHQNKDFRIESGILASNNEVLSAKLEHPTSFKYVTSLSTHPKNPCILTASREKIFLWQCPELNESGIE
ncbi:hypothetical protein Mgra_00003552 [Meloidogyne graminicola]|uniref:WD_REPEATS_REGION domain-containing protein n=1 Tax=Meloidogyne graminicola TaxID=189291 RepID=A0A8S9ZV07_9BILA|nr:hypothetical protein Mgra_00003552 [Meloidogyne graminicola]